MNRARPESAFDPQPDPNLSAQDVVRLQLDALQNNDLMPDNGGIRIAFRFASPSNVASVGPVERFVALVKSQLYAPLIGFERAELGAMRLSLSGEQAWQQVWLYKRGSVHAVFRWVLSRQTEPPHAGCWLVDAVIRTM